MDLPVGQIIKSRRRPALRAIDLRRWVVDFVKFGVDDGFIALVRIGAADGSMKPAARSNIGGQTTAKKGAKRGHHQGESDGIGDKPRCQQKRAGKNQTGAVEQFAHRQTLSIHFGLCPCQGR